MPEDELCKGIPIEFATFLSHCKNLKFEEKPDYAYLKNLFLSLKRKIKQNELTFD